MLATMMTRGFAAAETKAALAKAESAAGTARTPQYWTLLYGRISAAMAGADFNAARAGAEAFLTEAESLALPGQAAFARRLIGFQKLIAGDFPGAAADVRRALAETDAQRDAPLSDLFGIDVVATAMAACGQAIWYFGEFDEAARLIEAALARAKQSGRPATWLHANVARLVAALVSDRPDVVLASAEEAAALAARHDLQYWRVIGPFWADWARSRLGEPRSGDLRDAFAATSAIGVKLGRHMMWGMLADVERTAGRKREALDAVDRGLAISGEQCEGEVRTWLLRLRADLLSDGDPEGAEAGYREALRLSAEQGSPVFVLLAALSLARFLYARGRFGETYDTLSPALEGFSPTTHLPAIAEAEALLAAMMAKRPKAALAQAQTPTERLA
jgi:tetratricopeptide (TPR) repeat protein